MSTERTLRDAGKQAAPAPPCPQARTRNKTAPIAPLRLSSYGQNPEPSPHQTELFYLQKQIQAQTPMVLVLEDGEQIEGCIEWYDHHSLKLRGRAKTLVYKSAIKYMYKLGEQGV
jgi:sRNA-binding regulator protein Hfq